MSNSGYHLRKFKNYVDEKKVVKTNICMKV